MCKDGNCTHARCDVQQATGGARRAMRSMPLFPQQCSLCAAASQPLDSGSPQSLRPARHSTACISAVRVLRRSATCCDVVQLVATHVPQATLDSVGKLSATLQTRACPARQHRVRVLHSTLRAQSPPAPSQCRSTAGYRCASRTSSAADTAVPSCSAPLRGGQSALCALSGHGGSCVYLSSFVLRRMGWR